MAKEICISSTPHETRLAILEDDQLAEIYYERENEYTLAGSIYNGRVTRVLPGMQSAFVDLGLERDAFLYVTDFIELEDPEDTDELEKAAATGLPPREIRHSNGRQEERSHRRGQHREEREEPQSGEGIEEPTQVAIGEVSAPAVEFADESQQGEGGGRRWRGRRRRRGGRRSEGGAAGEGESEQAAEVPQAVEAEEDEPSFAPEIRAVPAVPSTPAPFVLPGESLSKYGGAPSPEAAKAAEPAVAPKRTHSSRPSTLVEAPLSWDGSGLLPGESLARHRNREAEPEVETVVEPEPAFSADEPREYAQTEGF